MIIPFDCIKDLESFQDAINRCCLALQLSAPGLYQLVKKDAATLDISLRFNPDEVVSIDFKINKIVR